MDGKKTLLSCNEWLPNSFVIITAYSIQSIIHSLICFQIPQIGRIQTTVLDRSLRRVRLHACPEAVVGNER